MLVPGFKFSAISAGIKKTKATKKDLALIFSEVEATVAGLFTTNKIKAASVKLDISKLASGRGQAIIVNSGNANACTGIQGLRDAGEMVDITAKELGINPELVYIASTGIIGEYLPMEKIRHAIPEAAKKLSSHTIEDVARAIMTTDTFPKIFMKKIKIKGKTGTIAGIAKGAGMIHPKLALNPVSGMATMLGFIMTDIAVDHRAINKALREATKKSFNRLTIDGDTSTNDTIIIMANGCLNNKPIELNSSQFSNFQTALNEVTYNLSRMIARDGEGATKLIEVTVKGAKTESDAEVVAFSIANSNLVKTAIYGGDANWGRIMAAIGYAGIDVEENRIDIYINGLKIVSKGIGTNKDKAIKDTLSRNEINIIVNIGVGHAQAKVLTCDLTEKYVKINSAYRS
ncbi:MAG: bifunctional glutamate N-acetyltransferase/amino-acid acetyltransferase ArgJ [Nitrospirae bacterium]|nr:bifunctional glutamate N-acetyltransferase/amino-acid acetyltransferase ArgJ [Nitrospirota bacterium]